ncbi:hypothetical protein LCL98_21770 [Rossellomorea aquimaris]|nr:hypothetical protein [Rossellomorea aquimaris]
MNRIISWKDILSEDYFYGLIEDSKRKEALDEWLVDGNFSCVKKNKRHLIKPYLKQEGLSFPSERNIKYFKRRRIRDILLTSTLWAILAVGSIILSLKALKM